MRTAPIALVTALFTMLLTAPAPADGGGRDEAAKGQLVFSVKTWEGEYTSRDVPGGVETTPVEGAIYTVRADGTGLTKLTVLEGLAPREVICRQMHLSFMCLGIPH